MTDDLIDVYQARKSLNFVQEQIRIQIDIEEKLEAQIRLLDKQKDCAKDAIINLGILRTTLNKALTTAILRTKSIGPSEAKEPT